MKGKGNGARVFAMPPVQHLAEMIAQGFAICPGPVDSWHGKPGGAAGAAEKPVSVLSG